MCLGGSVARRAPFGDRFRTEAARAPIFFRNSGGALENGKVELQFATLFRIYKPKVFFKSGVRGKASKHFSGEGCAKVAALGFFPLDLFCRGVERGRARRSKPRGGGSGGEEGVPWGGAWGGRAGESSGGGRDGLA